jgi:hypothetical protein
MRSAPKKPGIRACLMGLGRRQWWRDGIFGPKRRDGACLHPINHAGTPYEIGGPEGTEAEVLVEGLKVNGADGLAAPEEVPLHTKPPRVPSSRRKDLSANASRRKNGRRRNVRCDQYATELDCYEGSVRQLPSGIVVNFILSGSCSATRPARCHGGPQSDLGSMTALDALPPNRRPSRHKTWAGHHGVCRRSSPTWRSERVQRIPDQRSAPTRPACRHAWRRETPRTPPRRTHP